MPDKVKVKTASKVQSKSSLKLKRNIHDLFFRETFQQKPYSLELFSLVLKRKEYDLFDWETLKLELTTYIDEALREKRTDLIFSVCLRGKSNKLPQKGKRGKGVSKDGGSFRTQFLFLFEHKSYLDPNVIFQLLKYQSLIYEKKESIPVIPILFYHGKEEWTIPRSFKDFLIQKSLINKKLLKKCGKLFQDVLNFRYRLINLRDLNIDRLPRKWTTRSILFAMKHMEGFDLKHLKKMFSLSKGLIFEQKEGTIEYCVSYVNQCLPQRFTWKVLRETEKDVLQTGGSIMGAFKYSLEQVEEKALAKGVKKGIKKGIEKGIEKGMEKGRMEALFLMVSKMLEEEMDVDIISRLTGLSKDQILSIQNQKD